MKREWLEIDEWKTMLIQAYREDPCSRRLMHQFNHRVEQLCCRGDAVDKDSLAASLYGDLILAVSAYMEGKPIQTADSSRVSMH